MLITIQTVILLLLSSVVSRAPQASDPTPEPFDMLSLGHQRYLEDVAKHYWLAPDGLLWCSKVEDDGVGEASHRMSDQVFDGRVDAYIRHDAPRWYSFQRDVRLKSRDEVIRVYAYIANEDVYAARRQYGDENGLTIADRCQVVNVPVSGGGLLVNLDFGDGFEDRIAWIHNHPDGRNAEPGDILSLDYPLIKTNQHLVDLDYYEAWKLDKKNSLQKDYPTSTPDEIELMPLTAHDLANELYAAGIDRLPEWKLVKIKVQDAVPGKKTVRRNSSGGASFVTSTSVRKGKPAVYEWVYKLGWKPIRFKDD